MFPEYPVLWFLTRRSHLSFAMKYLQKHYAWKSTVTATYLKRSVSDTKPTIFELPCCSTHTSLSALDDENFLTTANRVSSGVHVCSATEEEACRWASRLRRGVSKLTGNWRHLLCTGECNNLYQKHRMLMLHVKNDKSPCSRV
jgi:hypothetical protein